MNNDHYEAELVLDFLAKSKEDAEKFMVIIRDSFEPVIFKLVEDYPEMFPQLKESK